MLRIKAEKDFWAGLIYLILGGAFLWFGRDYRFGTSSRMGPGYFPMVLAWTLMGFGVISLGRSFITPGEPVSKIMWKPLFLILAACSLFGVLLQPAGLAISLVVLCLVSAMASTEFRFEWAATAGLIGLIVFCVLVFVKGLGIPMPIFGSWFEPFLPQWLVR